MSVRSAAALAAALILATSGTSVAQEAPAPALFTPAQEARARALEGELRCPVCRSQSIRQSRSFMAEDMKRRIRELIAEGRTDEEVRDHFVARYGEWILLTPPRGGFSLSIWLPIFAVAVGAIGLVLAARSWSRRGAREPVVEPPRPSPHLSRLEREIEETK